MHYILLGRVAGLISGRVLPGIKSLTMQGFIGVRRIYLNHAAILLAVGVLLQLISFYSRALLGHYAAQAMAPVLLKS